MHCIKMKSCFFCCFVQAGNDPLEFSTDFSHREGEPDRESKIKEFRSTFLRTHLPQPAVAPKRASEVTVVTESIPVYNYSDGQYFDGGRRLNLVYTDP